ncbi:T9SS type A sorting domain-containing protein [Aquimarina agarivorans]|uniref:T9SS type A sorting domain-containing protein n=1 Tax=Aquimarina agarivorans TaxID=980584 RepID=UPI000248ED0A|nr:T9SS type A sorting domain-containing protein [Aquimarina agarivorans]
MKTFNLTTLKKGLFVMAFCGSLHLMSQPFTYQKHKNNRVISLQMSQAKFNQWTSNDEFADDEKASELVKDIYKNFNDDFDFITFILNTENTPSGISYAGKLSKISNTIKGIGIPVFDNSNAYGSSGKLKSIIQLSKKNNILYGPFLHELMHNWASYGFDTAGPRRGFSDNPDDFGPFFGHWGFTGGNTPGQLGGFTQSTLIDNGNNSYTVDRFGDFANGGNSVPYTQLELYLMGVISADAVETFDLFQNITSFSQGTKTGTYDFSANTRITYTPQVLVEKLGERKPSFTNATKEFSMLMVVITTTPLTEDEWTEFDNDVESFTRNGDDNDSRLYNFWEATDGKATLSAAVENTALNVTDFSQNKIQFNLFPNPVSNTLTVETTVDIDEIELYNSIGMKLKVIDASKEKSKIKIPFKEFSNGLYYLIMKLNNQIISTEKVVLFKS